MNHLEHTVFVGASIDLVWAYATELQRLTDWMPNATAIDGHINPGDEVGLQYSVWFGRLARMSIETTEMRPLVNHRRAFHIAAWLVHGEIGMTFEPADGGTIVTFTVDYDYDVAFIAKALSAMHDARIERTAARAVANFKNYVEAKHFARRRAAIRETTLAAPVNLACDPC